jgi:hypothetical protein
MRREASVLVLLLVLAGMVGCVDEVALPVSTQTPRLVVEGLITNQAPPYTVKLSYSGFVRGANSLLDSLGVENATVTISDDQGRQVELRPVRRGVYQTVDSTFRGTEGRSYSLSVALPDGRQFVSKPEQLLPVPNIERVYYQIEDKTAIGQAGYYFFLDTKDPGDSKNYYRWSAYGYSQRPSTGVCCTLNIPCTRCFDFCWTRVDYPGANVLSDELINGNQITKRYVLFTPLFTYGPHLIEVSQYSLTRQAYQFWQLYEEQRTRTGSILDPLPAPVEGNVLSRQDGAEAALGYFGASAVVTVRLKTNSNELDFNYVRQFDLIYRREGDCRLVWPGAEWDLTKAAGW